MGKTLTEAQGVDAVARAICAEQCAVYGEPPCYDHGWPNPDCDEPGCPALALAAVLALNDMETDDGEDTDRGEGAGCGSGGSARGLR